MSNIEEAETPQVNENGGVDQRAQFFEEAADKYAAAAGDERVPIVRQFQAAITADDDGRTVDARIVPYGVKARVADEPDYQPYYETWLAGVFERQMNAANRVLVNVEHEQGLRGIVGHGVSLQEHADGLYGTFRVRADQDGDKALGLINDGVLTGISLEAIALKSRRVGDVVERVRAHLDKVAFCRFPAFEQAQVLAVREAPILPEPVPIQDEMAERLAALGIPLLRRVTVVRTQWDGDASRFTDEEWERSCLIDRDGDDPVKERCSLPVLEPSGDLNANALGAADIARATKATSEQKASAARKLIRFYRLAEIEAPDTLRRLAAG